MLIKIERPKRSPTTGTLLKHHTYEEWINTDYIIGLKDSNDEGFSSILLFDGGPTQIVVVGSSDEIVAKISNAQSK